MGTTSLGFAYPDSAGTPRRQAIQDLAESIDDYLAVMGVAQAYTPVLSNWTLNSGTLTGERIDVGDFTWFRIRLTLAADTDVVSGPVFTLPATAIDNRAVVTTALFVDADGGASDKYRGGFAFTDTDSTIIVRTDDSSRPNGTTPFTWDDGDEIVITGTYRRA